MMASLNGEAKSVNHPMHRPQETLSGSDRAKTQYSYRSLII